MSFRKKLRNEKLRLGHYDYFIQKKDRPGYLVVTKNRIGLNDAARFSIQLDDYTSRYSGEVVLDLNKLDYLEDNTLGIFVQAKRRLGKRIKFIWPEEERVMATIRACKLERILV